MQSSLVQSTTPTIARRLASSWLLTILALTGLLFTPVSCLCGAQVPHGHSLFQLPHHHHGAVSVHYYEQTPDGISQPDQEVTTADGVMARTDAKTSSGAHECDETGKNLTASDDSSVALGNALEHSDGVWVQAPSSSSFGQPIAMAQPPQVSLPSYDCAQLQLPGVRDLAGTSTPPETPPPQA